MVLAVASLVSISAAQAQYVVTNTSDSAAVAGSLANALLQVNATGGTITFDSGLAGQTIVVGNTSFTSLIVNAAAPITIDGSGAPGLVISGDNSNRVLFVQSGTLDVRNLTIANGVAQGGNGGGGGGGGGMGAGGAIYVANGANVAAVNVTFSGNSAIGGTGGSHDPSYYDNTGGGGGGGLGGSGSTGTGPYSGALGANGGGFLPGSTGGLGGNPGGAGAAYEGGGGGNSPTRGGAGGYGGGGGGGGYAAQGGNGGFGGGGGGQGAQGSNSSSGGLGGVGAGNGADCLNVYCAGGAGGGGAGLGGAVFVEQGASLTISGTTSFAGGVASGGNGGNAAYQGTSSSGAGAGADLFLTGGMTLTLAGGTFNGSIADDSASSLPGGFSYTAGTGIGAALAITGGTVALNGANTYAGGTTVADGATLSLGHNSALGSGTLTMGVVFADHTALVLNGNGLNISNTMIFNSDPVITVATGNTNTLSGDISGAGDIVLNGGGTLVLSGANTYVAGTTLCGTACGVAGGSSTLRVGIDTVGTPGAIVSSAIGTGTLTFDGGTLQAGGNYTVANTAQVNSTGGAIDANGFTFTYSGDISDAPANVGGLTIRDSTGTTGVVVLSGNNTYSGGTVISAGILEVTNTSSVGTGTVTLDGGTFRADGVSDLTFTNNFAINAPGGTIDNNLTVLTLSGDITGAIPGLLTLTGGSGFGGITVLSGNNSYSGGTAVLATTVQVTNASSLGTGAVTLDWGTIQTNGTDVTLSNNIVLADTINVGGITGGFLDANGARLTIAGNISGAGALETQDSAPAGNSAVVLLGTNTYTGGTTICSCSTLQLGDATHTASILGTVTNDGGVFRIVNADTSGITSITNEFGGVTIFRNSTTAGTMTIDNETGGSVEFRQTSSAGNATINNNIGTGTGFFNNSTAGNATINNIGGLGIGIVEFNRFSRGGSATINNGGFSVVLFNDQTTLENAKIVNRDDGSVLFSSQSSAGTVLASITNNDFGKVHFINRSTAGSATIYNNDSGILDFSNRSTAGDATIINSSSFGMAFLNQSTAGNAFITTRNNSETVFFDRSDGGTARFETEAGSVVDFSGSRGPDNDRRINAGSIGGAGTYYIGKNNTLVTGGNNRSSEVSGVIADVDPCGCFPIGPGSLEKVGSGTMILSGTNTYTGTTGVFGGVLNVAGSIASSSLTTVHANAALTGAGAVGNTVIGSGGIFLPGNGTPGSSMTVSGNLAFQSGALYLVQLNSTTSTFANVTGTAALNGTVGASFTAGSIVLPRYTILTAAGGHSGSFAGVDTLGLPAGFVATLSYDPTHAYLNFVLDYAARSNLNVNQQNVNKTLGNFFIANGGIPGAFGGLSSAGLSQISGETATGSQQATFDAMNIFLGLLTDPFVAGRDGFGAASGGATPFAETFDSVNAYAAKQPAAAREAFAKFATKAKVAPNDLFNPRWSVWGAAYGGGSTTDGNAALGSNTATARAFGFVAGADYRFSPATLAGFALAGGGTSFGVNGFGSGRSDLFQAGAFVRHNAGPAYVTAALAYGWQDVATDRIVTVAGVDRLRAQFNANAWSGRVEGGYRYVTPWMGITPYAAGQFTSYQLPAYAEQVVSGANTFALNYAAKDVTASRSELGVRADKSFAMPSGIFTLRGRAAWAHNFNTDRSITPVFQTLPGASFVVNGAVQARDAALTTASAEMKWVNGWSAAATFEGEFSHVTRSYAGKGVARYTW